MGRLSENDIKLIEEMIAKPSGPARTLEEWIENIPGVSSAVVRSIFRGGCNWQKEQDAEEIAKLTRERDAALAKAGEMRAMLQECLNEYIRSSKFYCFSGIILKLAALLKEETK